MSPALYLSLEIDINMFPGSSAVRVTYETEACLRCLLCRSEVLVVSSDKKYVWMVYDRTVPECDYAKWTHQMFQMPKYPLRRISARRWTLNHDAQWGKILVLEKGKQFCRPECIERENSLIE